MAGVRQDPPLTAAQRRYLEAFDWMIDAWRRNDDDDHNRAVTLMRNRLPALLPPSVTTRRMKDSRS